MRRFLTRLLIFCALPALLLLAAEAVLQGSGELWPVRRVIEYQGTHPAALYMRGVDQSFYAYKYDGVLAHRPAVLVAGSSRTMKFRAGMFGDRRGSFFNAGGMLNSMSDVADFARLLPEADTPRLLLLGVDLWWLNDNVPPTRSFEAEVHRDAAASFDEHVIAIRWLVWHPRSFAGEAASLVRRSEPDAIGIAARENGGGFRADGSYKSPLAAPRTEAAWRFVDRETPPVVERAKGAFANFVPATAVSRSRLDALEQALQRFRDRGVLVVGYLPPFSSEVLSTLESDPRQRGIWSEFRCLVPQLFERIGFPVVDASDARALGMDDRAMSDGMHAEETFELHVLDALLRDARVRAALPGAPAAVARALASPRTNFWEADLNP